MEIPEARIIGPEGAVGCVVRMEITEGTDKIVLGFGEWLELPPGRYSVVGVGNDVGAGLLTVERCTRLDGIDVVLNPGLGPHYVIVGARFRLKPFPIPFHTREPIP